MTIDPRILELANQHLTPLQRDTWMLVHKEGWPIRRIAAKLYEHRSTITSRYDAALVNLAKHGVRYTPDGRPYLEETA